MGIEELVLQRSKNEGKAEGKVEKEERNTEIIIAQVTESDFTAKKIAGIVNAPASFVEY